MDHQETSVNLEERMATLESQNREILAELAKLRQAKPVKRNPQDIEKFIVWAVMLGVAIICIHYGVSVWISLPLAYAAGFTVWAIAFRGPNSGSAHEA